MSAFLAFRTVAVALRRPRVPPTPCLYQLSMRNKYDDSVMRPRNKDIPFKMVHLVDPTTGHLTELMSLESILASVLDRKLEYVELVRKDPTPIVKIVNKKDAFEKRKIAKKKASVVAKKNVQKEVQLTWGAAEGDFTHKLERIREELEKGTRIDLVYSHKKGQTLPTPEEMQKQVQTTVEMLVDVGKEWKPPEFKGKIAAVFLQGTAVSELEIMADDLLPRKEKLRLKRVEKAAKKEEKEKAEKAKQLDAKLKSLTSVRQL